MANTSTQASIARDGGTVTALSETFDTTGNGQWFYPGPGAFNVFVDFTTGTGVGSVQLMCRRGTGAALPNTGNGTPLYVLTGDAREIIVEVEPGISYRWAAAVSSGSISTTMSQFT